MTRSRTQRITTPSLTFLCAAALALGLAGCGESGSGTQTGSTANGTSAGTEAASTGDDLNLAVIPKGTTHIFWQSVESGARRAADELDVTIQWKGPLKESDRAGQIQVVQQFVSQGVDGIALAPLDSQALRGPVDAAKRADMPVVIFDSALKGEPGEDYVSFVATNNRKGGRLAGETLTDIVGDSGDVVLMRYQVGSASTQARESGFLDVMSENDGLNVTVKNRYAGATSGEAKTTALNMIDKVRSADAIFTPNESTTYGMLLALRQENLAGEKTFVGFDASPPLVAALESGEIDALVVQNPEKMGYTAVKTLTQHLRGEAVEPRIDTGVAVVTKDNMNDPDIKPLLPKSQ